MIISICQPYFVPYAGFFFRALMSDVLVLADAVQYPRGPTWLNRNRFKCAQGVLRLTVPIRRKGLGLQRIDAVRVIPEGRWRAKGMAALHDAYRQAPYFHDFWPWVTDIFSGPEEKLAHINVAAIQRILGYLEASTRVVRLSELPVGGREPDLTPAVCRHFESSCLLAPNSARKHLDEKRLHSAGVEVLGYNYRQPVYPQLWGPFAANLSILDLLFNCGPRSRSILTRHQAPRTTQAGGP